MRLRLRRSRYSREYKDYLASDTWRRVRQQAIRGARNRCEHCGARARIDVPWLEVNHKHYEKPFGTERWPQDLEALCSPCHRKADRARQKRNGSENYFRTNRRVRRTVPWAWIIGGGLLLVGFLPVLVTGVTQGLGVLMEVASDVLAAVAARY